MQVCFYFLIPLGVEWLSQRAAMFNLWRSCQTVFQGSCTTSFPAAAYESSNFSASSLTPVLLIPVLWWVWDGPLHDFNLRFLVADGFKPLSMCFLAICRSSEKCLFKSFAYSYIVFFGFLFLGYKSSVYILAMRLSWIIWFQIFPPTYVLSFHLLAGILWNPKVLHVFEVQFIGFLLALVFLVLYLLFYFVHLGAGLLGGSFCGNPSGC